MNRKATRGPKQDELLVFRVFSRYYSSHKFCDMV